MRKATADDFDAIYSLLAEIYEYSIWKELGPYNPVIAGNHIKDIIESNETYISDGVLVSVNISWVYHERPIANVVHFAVSKTSRRRKTVDDMFNVIENICRNYNCLAVFFVCDTISNERFAASFHNLMEKRGYCSFSKMYWGIHG